MTDTSFTLADVLRRGLPRYLERYGSLPQETFHVLNAIMACRTEAAGAHRSRCPQCGYARVAYNSCRNRHCPRCQAHKAAQWVEARTEQLLPVPYFHIVFTIPHELNPLALTNRSTFYGLFFRAVSETLLQLGADKKRLGGRIGFFTVLHTWTQTLLDHPHVHVVVPAVAIAPDKKRLKRSRPDYLFPVQVISSLLRGKLLSYIKTGIKKGEFSFHGSLTNLSDAARQREFFNILYGKQFVVYAKKSFATALHVVKYLSQYTHRIAISDNRIIAVSDTEVKFSWRDRCAGDIKKEMSLDIVEFIRRFLLHVLPGGFVRIRYFGFMANAVRSKAVELCRKLLNVAGDMSVRKTEREQWRKKYWKRCPCCMQADMCFETLVAIVPTG